MRILGLDVGESKIGAAISDNEEKIALPLKILKRNEKISGEIEEIIKRFKIEVIIIGIPYTLRGEIGNQAHKVISFVRNYLDGKGLKIEYIDERYTTKIPRDAGGKKKKSSSLDDLSACLILQSYLDKNKIIGT